MAYNQAWARTTNEHLARWRRSDGEASFRCECWQNDCGAELSLSAADWDMARAKPNRFAVAPHHVAEGVETVILIRPNFWLLEKFGAAGRLAEKLA